MSPKSKMWAVTCVFLLLSVHPIDASRLQETNNVLRVEGTDGAGWGASCETLQERFETHASTMSANVGLARNSTGRHGYLNTASVILRAVRMTRTLQRAGTRECEWARDGTANTAALMEVVAQTQNSNPCLPRAQQLLSSESSGDADADFDIFIAAMQVLVSPTCDLEASADEPEEDEDVDPAEVEEDTEGEADVLSAEVMEDLEHGGEASLLQSEDENPIFEWIGEHAWPPPSFSGRDFVNSEGVVTAIEGTGPANLGAWLFHIIGTGAWLIAFAVLCTYVVHAIAWVINFVFCLLRFALGLIFRRGWSLRNCVRGTMSRIRNSRSGQRLINVGCAIGTGGLMLAYGNVQTLIAPVAPVPGIPGIPGIPR